MDNTSRLNKFGEKLKYYLNVNGWSQKFFAEKLGTSQQTISRWINGECEPELDTLIIISYILNEDPNELLGYSDIPVNKLKNAAQAYE